jgi:hypothetical protein
MNPRLNPLQRLRNACTSLASSGLFDSNLYRQTYLRNSKLRQWPLLHYLLFGERAGHRPNVFFDPSHYRTELMRAGVCPGWPLLRHYAKQGATQSVAPSPEFHPGWYAWQNPDWNLTGAYGNPLTHYLHVGLKQLRDPSPFIDLRRHISKLGLDVASGPEVAILAEIQRHGRLSGPGITRDFKELRARQAAFRAGLNYVVIRRARALRRNLVFLQSGTDGSPAYLVPDRDFDVLRNYYVDPSAQVCSESDHVLFQRGTKVTSIDSILVRDPELLLAYDHVLFLDDDIELGADEISSFFATMERHDIALAQPLLTPESNCIWPIFKDSGHVGRIVPVSSVEVMMPGFSRDALRRLAWTFHETISGFGVDLLWGHTLAAERVAGLIAVIGSVVARHERVIDEIGGSFYNFMADNDINPKLELWMVISERSVVPQFRALNTAQFYNQASRLARTAHGNGDFKLS